jgi:hypothetical protein
MIPATRVDILGYPTDTNVVLNLGNNYKLVFDADAYDAGGQDRSRGLGVLLVSDQRFAWIHCL